MTTENVDVDNRSPEEKKRVKWFLIKFLLCCIALWPVGAGAGFVSKKYGEITQRIAALEKENASLKHITRAAAPVHVDIATPPPTPTASLVSDVTTGEPVQEASRTIADRVLLHTPATPSRPAAAHQHVPRRHTVAALSQDRPARNRPAREISPPPATGGLAPPNQVVSTPSASTPPMLARLSRWLGDLFVGSNPGGGDVPPYWERPHDEIAGPQPVNGQPRATTAPGSERAPPGVELYLALRPSWEVRNWGGITQNNFFSNRSHLGIRGLARLNTSWDLTFQGEAAFNSFTPSKEGTVVPWDTYVGLRSLRSGEFWAGYLWYRGPMFGNGMVASPIPGYTSVAINHSLMSTVNGQAMRTVGPLPGIMYRTPKALGGLTGTLLYNAVDTTKSGLGDAALNAGINYDRGGLSAALTYGVAWNAPFKARTHEGKAGFRYRFASGTSIFAGADYSAYWSSEAWRGRLALSGAVSQSVGRFEFITQYTRAMGLNCWGACAPNLMAQTGASQLTAMAVFKWTENLSLLASFVQLQNEAQASYNLSGSPITEQWRPGLTATAFTLNAWGTLDLAKLLGH